MSFLSQVTGQYMDIFISFYVLTMCCDDWAQSWKELNHRIWFQTDFFLRNKIGLSLSCIQVFIWSEFHFPIGRYCRKGHGSWVQDFWLGEHQRVNAIFNIFNTFIKLRAVEVHSKGNDIIHNSKIELTNQTEFHTLYIWQAHL